MALTKPPRPTLRPPMTLGELHQELLSICSQMRCGAAELEDSLCRTLSTGILRLPFRTQSLQKTRTSLVDGRSQRFVFPSCPRTPSLLTLAPSEFASGLEWRRNHIRGSQKEVPVCSSRDCRHHENPGALYSPGHAGDDRRAWAVC